MNQTVFYNLGGCHLVSPRPDWCKKAGLPQVKKNSSEDNLQTSSTLSVLPGADRPASDGRGHQLSWVSSRPAHTADLGFASLHCHVSHFLMINVFLCLYTHPIVSVSLENPDNDSSLTQSPNPACIQRFPSTFPKQLYA